MSKISDFVTLYQTKMTLDFSETESVDIFFNKITMVILGEYEDKGISIFGDLIPNPEEKEKKEKREEKLSPSQKVETMNEILWKIMDQKSKDFFENDQDNFVQAMGMDFILATNTFIGILEKSAFVKKSGTQELKKKGVKKK